LTRIAKLRERFDALAPARRRLVHQRLAEHALARWELHCRREGEIRYVEGVCGTRQAVDASLPGDALASVGSGQGVEDVEARYGEPITAMQDGDLSFRESATFAYYAIYNFFRRYGLREEVDDWLLVNQAISSEEEEWRALAALKEAIDTATEKS
jgi:hypothetical protein